MKEKYFTLVNKKQEIEEKPRQIVINFGKWHSDDAFANKIKEWQIQDFE